MQPLPFLSVNSPESVGPLGLLGALIFKWFSGVALAQIIYISPKSHPNLIEFRRFKSRANRGVTSLFSGNLGWFFREISIGASSSFISVSQFQTVSNPLRTQAGNSIASKFPLNVTTYGNLVNLTTGVVDATVTNIVYNYGQLAVYQDDKVLLPIDLFGNAAASVTEKPVKGVPGADSPTGSSKDSSADVPGAPPVTRFVAICGVLGIFIAYALQQSVGKAQKGVPSSTQG